MFVYTFSIHPARGRYFVVMGKKSKPMDVEESGIAEVTEAVEPAPEGVTYEDRLQLLNPISKPLAGRKLTKKIYKLIKKGI